MNKGMNLRSVKNENRTGLLYLLNTYGALSRKDLAAKLSLTPAAVTKITSQLIEQGYIRESGEVSEAGKSGRPERLLSLCNEERFSFGINAETDGITLSLTTLSGKLIKEKKMPFTPSVAAVIEAGSAFLSSCENEKECIIGVGVCIIGSQEADDFGIWKEPHLQERFEAAFGLPVVIENNVKAFAESELLFGKAKALSSALFLKWGPGIGSSIIADGRVFSGNDSSVAEIGHYIVNKGGERCRCGRFGCLETEASLDAIKKELKTDLPLDELLLSRDNMIVSTIEQKIDMVALALTNTATILNTETIVLFGSMFHYASVAQKLSRQCVRYNSNLKPEMITISSLNDKREYIGACAICAKKFFFESEGQ